MNNDSGSESYSSNCSDFFYDFDGLSSEEESDKEECYTTKYQRMSIAKYQRINSAKYQKMKNYFDSFFFYQKSYFELPPYKISYLIRILVHTAVYSNYKE